MAAKRSAAASRKLGTPVSIHYLDGALHSNRMTKKTLDAMMGAITEAKPIGQRALRLQARALKVPALHPSDLLAPPPAFPGALPPPPPPSKDTQPTASSSTSADRPGFLRTLLTLPAPLDFCRGR